MPEYLVKNMTAAELKKRAAEAPAIILPLASVEILGAHGPVGLDLCVADAVTEKIARLSGCLAAPAVPYGDTLEFDGMDGTVHVPANVLEEYIYAVAKSYLTACGAKAIVFFNVHSLNGIAAAAVCRRLKSEGYKALCSEWWSAISSSAMELLDTGAAGTGHGGEMITSVALALCGEYVRMDLAENEVPMEGLAKLSRWNGTPFKTFGNFREYCKGGAWGDTTAASAEKGQKLIEAGCKAVAAFLSESL